MRKISSRASLSKSAALIVDLADAVMQLGMKGKAGMGEALGLVSAKTTGSAEDIAEVVAELKKLDDDELRVAVNAMKENGVPVPEEILSRVSKVNIVPSTPKERVDRFLAKIEKDPSGTKEIFDALDASKKAELEAIWKNSGRTDDIGEYIGLKISGRTVGVPAPSISPPPAAAITPPISPPTSVTPSSVDLAIKVLDPNALSKVSKLIDDQKSILDIGTILHLNKEIPNIAITEGVASKMLALYKSDPVKYIDDYSKLSPEARATLMSLESSADDSAKTSLKEIDRLIEKDVENIMSPGAKEVGLSPGVSPAKKAIRWGRVGAAVAAGLGGMALLNYVFSDDGAQEEGRREISKNRENTTPYGTSDSGYESSSLIMKEKGYLKSVQSSWTQEFDTAFRAFIDAGSANGAVPTDLVGGQSWSDVAGSLGFPPNKSGAFSAIRYLADLVGKKTSTPTTGVTTPAPSEAPASTTPVAAEDNPVLAAIIGAMYNQKLVGTPGFDLIKEPKRIRALIESEPVGGPNPTGYGNAARIVMRMNPAIRGMLPAQLTRPVDEVFAKNPANKALLQAIQVAINGIYESAIPTLVKPGLERSRELIARYLSSTASGKWTVNTASNSVDQWVKLASERKMRIRAEIAAEMTPAEMAAARRIKMREI